MKFHEVLAVINEKYLVDLYSEIYDIPYIRAYPLIRSVVKELKGLEIDNETIEPLEICITEKEGTVDVYGKDSITGETFELGLIPWEAWLNSSINDSSFYKFSVNEMVTHFIYEMTYHGTSNEEIKKKASELEELFEKISSGETEVIPSDLTELLNLEDISEMDENQLYMMDFNDKKNKLN